METKHFSYMDKVADPVPEILKFRNSNKQVAKGVPEHLLGDSGSNIFSFLFFIYNAPNRYSACTQHQKQGILLSLLA